MKQVAFRWLQVDKWSPELISVRGKETGIEVDLMMGKNHQGALLVMTDRATLHTHLHNLPNKKSHTISQSIRRILHKATYPLHTLTFDNDKAFAGHQAIGHALGLETYFTRPYTSQDKGTVENRIGQIRRSFPKKTDLLEISHHRVRQVEEFLNNRPVRKFQYKTPNQALQEKLH
jgi:IS30 family transposase